MARKKMKKNKVLIKGRGVKKKKKGKELVNGGWGSLRGGQDMNGTGLFVSKRGNESNKRF